MRKLLRMAGAIDRTNDWIGKGIRWLVLAMVLVGAYNAVARYLEGFTEATLRNNSLFDLQWYLFTLIFLLGAAYGLRHDVHVRVDVSYSRFGRRGKAWIDLAGSLLFLLPFALLMLWVAWPAVRNSWVIRETSPDPGGLARYPIKAVILISFALLAIQGISQIIKQVAILRGIDLIGGTAIERSAADGIEEREPEVHL